MLCVEIEGGNVLIFSKSMNQTGRSEERGSRRKELYHLAFRSIRLDCMSCCKNYSKQGVKLKRLLSVLALILVPSIIGLPVRAWAAQFLCIYVQHNLAKP